MSAPKVETPNLNLRNPGNLVGDFAVGTVRGLSEINEGAKQTLTGRVDQGVSRMLTGGLAYSTGGISERILPTDATKGQMLEDAAAQSAKDAQTVADAEVEKRKEAIRTRVNAEVALRVRQPGRSQTLLTPATGNSPLPRANNSILTVGNKNGR